jgi:uncharacterized membrane protein
MTDNRVRKIAAAGVLSAVSIVLGITGLGFITWIPGVALTFMHVPVIIGAILEGPAAGAFIGLLFGVSSLIQASIIAVQPGDLAFVNPLISVVPRLFIGPAAWFFYVLISGRLFRKDERPYTALRVFVESLGIAAGAVMGSLVNTVLVLSALGLFQVLPRPVLFTVALTNGPLEAGISAAIALAVISAWKHIPRFGGRSRLSRREERLGGE